MLTTTTSQVVNKELSTIYATGLVEADWIVIPSSCGGVGRVQSRSTHSQPSDWQDYAHADWPIAIHSGHKTEVAAFVCMTRSPATILRIGLG